MPAVKFNIVSGIDIIDDLESTHGFALDAVSVYCFLPLREIKKRLKIFLPDWVVFIHWKFGAKLLRRWKFYFTHPAPL